MIFILCQAAASRRRTARRQRAPRRRRPEPPSLRTRYLSRYTPISILSITHYLLSTLSTLPTAGGAGARVRASALPRRVHAGGARVQAAAQRGAGPGGGGVVCTVL